MKSHNIIISLLRASQSTTRKKQTFKLFPIIDNVIVYGIKKTIHVLLLFVICYLLSAICYGQVTQEWVHLYPDTINSDGIGHALTLDDSGNVYVTGLATMNNIMNYCTIKYSFNGIQQWVRLYQGSNTGGRQAYTIAVDKISNVYVTGYDFRSGNYFDYCTIKYNSSGVQQWVQYYDGPIHGDDEAEGVALDNAGNVYVSGFSQITGGNGYAYTTVKYSSDGRQLWIQSYGQPNALTYVHGLAVDDSCNVYLTGENYGKSVTIKYDSSGNQLWVQTYSGIAYPGRTGANSITLDKYNNVYIAGFSQGIITWFDFFTIKYSSTGVQQWVRRYNVDSTAYSNYEANSIAVNNSGSVYVSGFSTSDQDAPMKLCTVKYSNNGDLIWERRESDTLSDQSTNMSIDSTSNVYITGSTSYITNHSSITTRKYDSSGTLKWIVVYKGGDGRPNDIKVDKNSCIFITGVSSASMCTIKYSQATGIRQVNSNIPKLFKLYQNYPNPFNPSTKFKILISKLADIKVKVCDITGKLIATLINQRLLAGTYELEFDGTNYSSGIYFYSFYVEGNLIDTKKMILLK